MNTKLRFLLAVALFVAIVIAGIGAPAWAEKLNIGTQANGVQAGLPAGSRPQGSAVITPLVVTLTAGETATIGSCATALVTSPPADVVYTAEVVPDATLPSAEPGNLISCGIKIQPSAGATLGAEVLVCFPLPPTQTGFAYYWDGTKWVKTTLAPQDGQSCVSVPATAANPVFAGLLDE